MAGECNSADQISEIAQKDVSRLVGTVAKTLAANSVFINVIGGGVFPSGVSDEIRFPVQMQAAPGDSLALPTFQCDTEVCGTNGIQDLTDAIDFTARLETKRGRGPRVCVKKGYAAFKSSYLSAEDSLRKLITQYVNSDIRAQLYLRSASKFNAVAGYDFDSLFTGGTETDLGVQFAPLNPTGPLSFKALHYVTRFVKEALFASMFDSEGKGMPHARFIGSSDIIESFRNEIGVKEILIGLTTGGYKLGEQSVSAYQFEEAPAYRGIAFGVDQRPLRATGFDGDGNLILVDPVVNVANVSKNTAFAKINPAWLAASYEVGFLMFDNTFNRLVPEKYVGEGTFKYAPQLHMGELEWHYIVDNDCNPFGDFGWHKYQITRAYQPIRPQHVVPILYKRCTADLGLPDCSVVDASGFSGSDAFATLGVCDS